MDTPEAGKALAVLLLTLKERSGLSYEELGRRTFTSGSSLHRYCRGQSTPPNYDVVARIAQACGASVAEQAELLRCWTVPAGESQCLQQSTEVLTAPASPFRKSDSQPTNPGFPARPQHGGTQVEGVATDIGRAQIRPRTAESGIENTSAPDHHEQPSERSRVPARLERRPRSGARILQILTGTALFSAVVAASLTAVGGPFSPAVDHRTTPQHIAGPTWEQASQPVQPTFFGATVNSNSGAMPSFRMGAVRFWDSGTTWAHLQPNRDEYDWTTLDRLVTSANEAGLPTLFVIGGTPAWAAPNAESMPYPNKPRASAPDDLTDWDNFIHALADRYQGRIESYELWVLANDPRFYRGSMETLVEMVRRANSIIKQIDPEATVVCPGMGQLWTPEGREALKKFAGLGGYQHCDVASVKLHQRVASDPPETLHELVTIIDRTMHEAGVHPPLWNTGTTYDIPLQKSLDEERSVNYATRFFLIGLVEQPANLGRMYFYNWGGTKIPLVLQAVGGVPTKAALAVEQLQRWLAHAQIRSCGHGQANGLPENVWQCEFTLTEPEGVRDAVIRWTHAGTATTDAVPHMESISYLDGTATEVHQGDPIMITERPILISSRISKE